MAESKWIPIKDQPVPTDKTEILVHLKEKSYKGEELYDVVSAEKDCGILILKGTGGYAYSFDEITHWMPLPELPTTNGDK